MTLKQEKFVLARIHFYEERITALETRIQELAGCSVPGSGDLGRVDDKKPDNKD
jgi:hypothetical protein